MRLHRGALAVVVAASLAAGSLAVAGLHQHSSADPLLAVGPDKPVHPSLQADLPTLENFVEEFRRLTFTHPVTLSELDQGDYLKAAGGDGGDGATATQDEGVLYAALGLVADSSAYDTAPVDVTDILGFYDDGSNTVTVPAGPDTPFLRDTVVHELTHALDDQHFDLAKVQARAADTTDGYLGADSLIEGDAVRAEDAYQQDFTPAEKALYDKENQAATAAAGRSGSGDDRLALPAARQDKPESGDDVLDDFSDFPYDYGPDYVTSLADEGDEDAVDEAFDGTPPRDTQIVLDQDEPDATVPTATAPALAPNLTVAASDSLGSFGVDEVLRTTTLGSDTIDDDSDAWAGDRIVAYVTTGFECYAWHIRTSGRKGATALEHDFGALATSTDHLSINADPDRSGLTVDGCHPA